MAAIYASDLMAGTDKSKSTLPTVKLGNGIFFSISCGIVAGLSVAHFRHTGYLSSIVMGGLVGGIIGKAVI